MPTYEYRCPQGHDFEKFFRKISDGHPQAPCPVCGQTAERKVSGGAGLLFKGSGFYITDYGKDGKKDQRAPSSGGDKKKAEGSSASSSAGESGSSGSSSSSSAASSGGGSESKPSSSSSSSTGSSGKGGSGE